MTILKGASERARDSFGGLLCVRQRMPQLLLLYLRVLQRVGYPQAARAGQGGGVEEEFVRHQSLSYMFEIAYLASSSQQPYDIGTIIPITDEAPKAETIQVIHSRSYIY